MQERYLVVHANERSQEEQDSFGSDCWHLIDTRTNQTIWSDGLEPEDAVLVRGLRFLVDLLNETESNVLVPIKF